jgi:hypothetical protein
VAQEPPKDNRRSQIVMALNTDFRSQCHMVGFLLHTVFGVFQQYRRTGDIPAA